MKLPDLLPPSDLLKQVEGIESGLRQRQRLGMVGLILALLQIIVLVINNKWLEGLATTDWATLIKERWWLLLILAGIVSALILAAWSRFWLEESRAPFRYTYSIADFKPVGDKGEASKEERLSVQMSHDLAQRLNERIKRLSLLDDEHSKEPQQKPESESKRKSHIHIKGFFLIRRNPDGQWFIEVMPRVRIGPPSSPETLAHVVRFKLPDDGSAKNNGAQSDESPAPQMTGRQYEQILERVYFSVATEIYKQIQQDVRHKIKLLPNDYYKAVALFHEAEDYAASNTLDAYKEALSLYDEAIKAFDPSRRRSLKSRIPRQAQKLHQGLNALWSGLKTALNHVWPKLGTVELMCARSEIGHATMLYYRRTLASILSQKANSPFEARPIAQSARDRLNKVSNDLPGRNDSLFDANVTLCLAWQNLGALCEAEQCLDESLRLNPARAESDPKYLFAAAQLKTISSEILQLYQRAVELEPRFDVAQFSRAIRMEMDWRTRPLLERNVAELVFREYEELLKTNPGNVGAWSNIGYMRWLLDDTEKAKESFEVGREYKDIKRETFVAELDYGLARIAAEAGEFDTAYQYFDSGFSALIAQGVRHGSRGETAEFYHYDFINETIIERFERYKQRIEDNRRSWDEIDKYYDSFAAMITSLGDQTQRDSAIKALCELFFLVAKRMTLSDRRLLQDWAGKQGSARIKTSLQQGDLNIFAEQIKTSFTSQWDDQFGDELKRALLDRAFSNLIDKYTPKKRIRDAVQSFVLEDYGNACYRFYLRTGDSTYFDKSERAYQEAVNLKGDFVLPYYRLYTRMERKDEHIKKVIELAESWPDGKLERSRTEIEKLWDDREKSEVDARKKVEQATENQKEAGSLRAKAIECRANAKMKFSEAEELSEEDEEITETEKPEEQLKVPAPSGGNFNQQIAARTMQSSKPIESGNGSEEETKPGTAETGIKVEESKRQGLEREARELIAAAEKFDQEAVALEKSASQLRTEAETLTASAAKLEIPEDTLIDLYLKDFLPHKWLWMVDPKTKKSRFNWKALNDDGERKWEKEFNALHVAALLIWAQAREKDKAVLLLNHLQKHFWPEDFDLIRARRRLLRDSDKQKDSSEEKLRSMVKTWLPDSPFSVINWWYDTIFTGDDKKKAYVEAIEQDGLSKQCYTLLGDRLVELNATEDALNAYSRSHFYYSARFKLGEKLKELKKEQEAIAAYLEAAKTNNPGLLLSVGNAFFDIGKPKQGIDAYRRAMKTCDQEVLVSIAEALESRNQWADSLRAYQRARACDDCDDKPSYLSRRDYHLRIGRNLLALGRESADTEFDAIGKIPEMAAGTWRTKIVQDALGHITSMESYRLLRAWLDSQREKCLRESDSSGYRDASEAILLLAQAKYFNINRPRAGASSFKWHADVSSIAIEADAKVFLNGESGATVEFQQSLDQIRERIEREMGVLIPRVRIRGNEEQYLKNSYIIMVDEVPLVMGTVQPERKFLPHYKDVLPALEVGTGIFNPQSGEMDGAWVEESQATTVPTAGERLWNHLDYAAYHLEAHLRSDLTPFLGLEQVWEQLAKWQESGCENEAEQRKALVSKSLPDANTKLRFTQILRGLAREAVPINDLATILKRFCELTPLRQDLFIQIELIRLLLKSQLPGNNDSSRFLYLAPAFEEEMARWIQRENGKQFFAIEPETTQALLTAVRQGIGSKQQPGLVIVTRTYAIRPFVRRLIELEFPRVMVLSSEELRRDLRGQVVEIIEYEK